MSNLRRVRISFPGNATPSEIQSDAKTWGELKSHLENELGSNFENTKVRDFETKHHYDDADATLPAGELKLLVSTDKNKSGMAINKGNYHKASYSDLRTFCKKITGFGPNGKDLCLEALDKHYAGGEETPKETKKASKKAAKATETIVTKVKTTKGSSDLEARVSKLEKAIFGDGEEDSEYLAAARANQ